MNIEHIIINIEHVFIYASVQHSHKGRKGL